MIDIFYKANIAKSKDDKKTIDELRNRAIDLFTSKYFTDVNKIHTHFLLRKDVFKSHAWKRDDLILKYYPCRVQRCIIYYRN